jgi:hypothetical protein
MIGIARADCRALHDAVVRFKTSPRQKENPPKHAPKVAPLLNRLPPRQPPSCSRLSNGRIQTPTTAPKAFAPEAWTSASLPGFGCKKRHSMPAYNQQAL